MNEARERSQRAERMRQERATEAKQLIQGASSEARKIFTRNSSQVEIYLFHGYKIIVSSDLIYIH